MTLQDGEGVFTVGQMAALARPVSDDLLEAFRAGHEAGYDEAMWGGWQRYPRGEWNPSVDDFFAWWLSQRRASDD